MAKTCRRFGSGNGKRAPVRLARLTTAGPDRSPKLSGGAGTPRSDYEESDKRCLIVEYISLHNINYTQQDGAFLREGSGDPYPSARLLPAQPGTRCDVDHGHGRQAGDISWGIRLWRRP